MVPGAKVVLPLSPPAGVGGVSPDAPLLEPPLPATAAPMPPIRPTTSAPTTTAIIFLVEVQNLMGAISSAKCNMRCSDDIA